MKKSRKVAMFYSVHVSTYNPVTGKAKNVTYKANSMAEALAIEHATDPDNAVERTVTVEPDVLAYMDTYYPGSLERVWPRSH